MDTLFHQLASLGGAYFAIAIFALVYLGKKTPNGWLIPLFTAILFLAYSGLAVYHEGPLGFWPEHTRNFWGVQIWYDLLLAAAAFWVLMLPRAKKQGMNLVCWGLFVICSGSLGIYLMLARLLYLEKKDPNCQPKEPRFHEV